VTAGGPDRLGIRKRAVMSGRARPAELSPNLQRYAATGEALVAEPFRGITADGVAVPDLFPLASTGVSTRPILGAAQALLAALDDGQRARVAFDVGSDAWRRWSNIHPFIMRHGVSLDEMTPRQRQRALALLEASLGTAGYTTMQVATTLAEHRMKLVPEISVTGNGHGNTSVAEAFMAKLLTSTRPEGVDLTPPKS